MRSVNVTLSIVACCVLFPALLDAQDPDYTLDLPDIQGPIDGTATVAVTLTSLAADIEGFQFDVCDDSLVDTGFGAVVFGAAIGDGAFVTVSLSFDADAWSASALLTSFSALAAGSTHELLLATYELLEEGESELEFCGTLLAPLVTTTAGDEVEPVTGSGTISIALPPVFLRGDINGDGSVEALSDAAYLIRSVFLDDGPPPPCRDAADVNNDGIAGALVDSLGLLIWAFSGGAPPALPGTETCGGDPEGGDLGCEVGPDPCPGEPLRLEADPGLVLRFGPAPAIVVLGADVVIPVLLEVAGDPIHGFQFGVCHDAGLSLRDGAGADFPVAEGADLPDRLFASEQVTGDGWTAGVLLDIIGDEELSAGEYEIYTATYTVIAEGLSAVEFCDTLGDPPVPTRVLRGGELVLPTTEPSGVSGVATPEPGLLLSSAEGSVGGSAEVAVYLTNLGDPLEGWRWGVCDDELVSLESGSITEGAALTGLVFEFQLLAAEADGWTASALLDGSAGDLLAAGTALEMYRSTYVLDEAGFSTLSFCETLGNPPVTVRWVVAGTEIEPETFDGAIAIQPPFPFAFTVEAPIVSYDPEDVSAGIAFSVDLRIEEHPATPGFPNDTQGFSMGLAHDGALLEATDGYATGVLAALDGGTGPGLVSIDLTPSNSAGIGVTVEVLYGASGDVFLQFAAVEPVIRLEYQVIDRALSGFEGNLAGVATTLEWSDALGAPETENAIVQGGVEVEVGVEDGTVFLAPEGALPLFLRGDCDGNGEVFALIDAIFVLEWGFLGGENPPCLDAADVDDSGTVVPLLDALYLLQWAYINGDAPPAPGADRCGPDLPEDGVTCDASPDACP